MKACLKYLKSQESCDKKDGDREPRKKEKVWLPCGLLSLMKILRRGTCKVDEKVVKPLTNEEVPRKRRFGKNWSKVT